MTDQDGFLKVRDTLKKIASEAIDDGGPCKNTSQSSELFDCDDCKDNLTHTPISSRIVGGILAQQNNYPAQVAVVQFYKAQIELQLDHNNIKKLNVTLRYLCGGTLINKHTIITSAHCIRDKNIKYYYKQQYFNIPIKYNNFYPNLESMFKIYLGITDITFLSKDLKPTNPGIEMTVKRIIRHPLYNRTNYLHDVALLTLNEDVIINSYVKPACLPRPNIMLDLRNKESWAVGWGSLKEGGNLATQLNEVKLQIYDESKCSNVYTTFSKLWDTQICAGDLDGNRDTCQGDSGGGLYYNKINEANNKRITNLLIGITSYGEGCGRQGKPGIYTRISYYLDWINSNL